MTPLTFCWRCVGARFSVAEVPSSRVMHAPRVGTACLDASRARSADTAGIVTMLVVSCAQLPTLLLALEQTKLGGWIAGKES